MQVFVKIDANVVIDVGQVTAIEAMKKDVTRIHLNGTTTVVKVGIPRVLAMIGAVQQQLRRQPDASDDGWTDPETGLVSGGLVADDTLDTTVRVGLDEQ